jgi:hypothetical protein
MKNVIDGSKSAAGWLVPEVLQNLFGIKSCALRVGELVTQSVQ